MLKKPVNRIIIEDGKVCGIESPGENEDGSPAEGKVEVARAPLVICDPSYVAGSPKVRALGKVVRAICVLTHPIADTNGAPSCQIIIPQRQLKRRSDIFILMVSAVHCAVPEGKYLAIVSTTVETSTPELELKPALELLGAVEAKFVTISDLFEPTDDGTADGLFVTKSYDATSHFESVADDVLDIYKRITGQELDMSIPADLEQED
jgi:Rab GDP dissociation inhibitor